MFKTRFTSLALAALLAVGATGISAAATDITDVTTSTGITLAQAQANIDAKLEEFAEKHGITIEEAEARRAAFRESGKTMEGMKNIKAELDEKGLTLEQAKENFAGKLQEFATAHGLTIEEAQAKIAEMKANGRTFEGLKQVKDKLSNIPA